MTTRFGYPATQGFAWLPLLPYLIGAALVVGILAGTYYQGREAGKEVVRAELQPLLTACNTAREAQNRAVEALAAESKAKQQKATRMLKDATRAAVGAIREADRLRGLAKAGSGGCGQALEEIRRGLKDG